jgi:hypothetical protein
LARLPHVLRRRRGDRSAARAAVWLALVATVVAFASTPSAIARQKGSDRAGATSASPGFGTLGGYVWQGHTRSVAASWVVATIPKGSRSGVAATWVGAQQGFGHSERFIQVGTNQVRDLGPGHSDFSFAFWTDTARHFHPVFLFVVPPGTRVSASLRLAGDHWMVSIRDAAAGHEVSFTTTQDTFGAFNLAEWLQEDPTGESGPEPYPALYHVEFDKVSLNGAIPQYARLHSQWMSVNSLSLGPSPFVGDSFKMLPRTLGAPARRFVAIAGAVDPQFNAFGSALSWKVMPNLGQLDAARASFAAALTRNIDSFEREQWPSNAVSLIHTLAARTGLLQAGVEQMPGTTQGQVDAWRRRLVALEQPINPLAQQIRRLLGAPQIQDD